MKCLDCGYDITEEEKDEHIGHKIIEGSFREDNPPVVPPTALVPP